MSDLISRQAAINTLWKALYDYEDKTERQYLDANELDVGEWFVHRLFVQNMSDIDRKVILELPSAQPEQRTGEWILLGCGWAKCSQCGVKHINVYDDDHWFNFCPHCGTKMEGVKNE